MKKTVKTFKSFGGGASILDRVRAASAIDLQVVPVPGGAVVTDPTHLKFNATYRTELAAGAAAFLAMARRAR